MQIVIDIPEGLKNKIDNANENNYRTYLWWFETTLYCAIREGTPLPKGHGELVDIRPLMRGLYEEMCVGELTYTTSEVYKMLENEAPTIIEADKGESEE